MKTGSFTIIHSFVMLCIVTFCALALLSANADYRLSKNVADQTSACYEATEAATRTLSEIDLLLSQVYAEHPEESSYYDEALSALKQFQKKNPHIQISNNPYKKGITVTYKQNFLESESLCVSLDVCYPLSSDGVFYHLTKWNTSSGT